MMNRDRTPEVELNPQLPESVPAPVRTGDEVGSVEIVMDGRRIAEIPVVCAGDVERQGFYDAWTRAWSRWLF